MRPKVAGKFGAIGCNQEITPDGKWVVHVIDWANGSGIFRVPFDIEKGGKDEAVNLGWPRDTDNYFPDVNPDCKYMVYGHWKTVSGDKDRYSTAAADLYVCRWPPDGVSARITWHGGTTQNPHWWGPAAK
jgi:Tol biopolymer transport system component